MREIAIWAFAACLPLTCFGAAAAPDLTAEQIVERNVAARGGLEAWRKVQTMRWVGHVESAATPASKVSFVLDQKRPNSTRFEIRRQDQIALRVYDGKQGWKLRPTTDGMPEVKPFAPDELAFARDGQGIDGPLIDHAARGIAVELDGMDELDGRKAYLLTARLPSGTSQRIWVDAETFLDMRVDRKAASRTGRTGTTSVLYRDYRSVEGLQVPLTIETGGGAGRAADRMVLDRVALNPPLDDRNFARPQIQGEHRGTIVDARSPQPAGMAIRPGGGSLSSPARAPIRAVPGAARVP